MFNCLGLVASIIFELMCSEISQLQGPVCFRSEEVRNRLYKWKRNNVLFTDLMEHFNKSFGLILLFYVGTLFVCSTFKSFLIINYLTTKDYLTAIITLIIISNEIIFFVATLYIPHKIRNEVRLTFSVYIRTVNTNNF